MEFRECLGLIPPGGEGTSQNKHQKTWPMPIVREGGAILDQVLPVSSEQSLSIFAGLCPSIHHFGAACSSAPATTTPRTLRGQTSPGTSAGGAVRR